MRLDPLNPERSEVQDSSDARKLPDDWHPVTIAGMLRLKSSSCLRREGDALLLMDGPPDLPGLDLQEGTAGHWNAPADQ